MTRTIGRTRAAVLAGAPFASATEMKMNSITIAKDAGEGSRELQTILQARVSF